MNNWQKIWNKDERINKIILEALIKADGFDSGAGSFTVDDWARYVQEFYKTIGVQENNSVFDVGCGSGAFVYPLYLNNHKVGGVDYSVPLIELANTIILNSDFEPNEAINIDINNKYDFVISHSVFHYFKDLDYARDVLVEMIQKANKKIAILDINDKSKEGRYHQLRMGGMNKQEYEKKYQGLNHLFYEKNWFEKIAKNFNLNINIFDQTFESYSNSSLRFNVIMEKVNA